MVSDALCQSAKARQALTRRAIAKGITRARRPLYLFSGLTLCGTCGGGFIFGSKNGLVCFNARERGTCSSRRRINRLELEGRVLTAMRERLFDPGCFEEFCQSFTEEMTRLRREHLAGQAGQRRELAAVAHRQKEILDAIVQGYWSEAWKAELLALDAKKEQLDATLRVQELPALHPNMTQVYRDKATALAAGLEREDERDGAHEALRGFIEKIVIPPDGLLQVVGNLGSMLAAAQGRSLSYEIGAALLVAGPEAKAVCLSGSSPSLARIGPVSHAAYPLDQGSPPNCSHASLFPTVNPPLPAAHRGRDIELCFDAPSP
jgi:hypothetical protein